MNLPRSVRLQASSASSSLISVRTTSLAFRSGVTASSERKFTFNEETYSRAMTGGIGAES